VNTTAPGASHDRARSPAERVSGFTRLPRRGRNALLVLLGLVLVVDVSLYLSEPDQTWRSIALGLAATLATALFAWWPPAAVVMLSLTALLETATNEGGPQLLHLVVVAGLVVYTCPGWFIGAYVVCTVALAGLTATVPGAFSSAALPVLAMVMVVSAGIGWALRTAHRRVRRFARDIEQLEQARREAIHVERERIADELHDIIAHDVTLVSMHARVLERVDDQALREQSIRAIRSSADQALADIRRMLRIVRDDRPGTPADHGAHASVASALDEVTSALRRLGAQVTVRARLAAEMSAAIEQTIVHVLREGATNIAKHGAGAPVVSVVVETVDDEIRVELTNTVGDVARAPYVPSSGYGLDRLRERVTLLDGQLVSESRSGSWVLRVHLPLR